MPWTLDGTNDFLQIPDDSRGDHLSPPSLTIACWTRPRVTAAGQRIFSLAADDFWLGWSGATFGPRLVLYNGANRTVDSGLLVGSRLYLIAASFDSTELIPRIHVNGQLAQTGATLLAPITWEFPGAEVGMGGSATGVAATFMNGEVGPAYLWKARLTNPEQQQLFVQGHPRGIRPAALIGAWRDDDGRDSSPYGRAHFLMKNGATPGGMRLTPVRPYRFGSRIGSIGTNIGGFPFTSKSARNVLLRR